MDQATTSLRQRREAAGLSIRELERLTGINRGRLSIIERGVTPSHEESAKIEAAIAQQNAA
jgi:transcriptional regulator with XRE-family HTH domain